MQIDLGVALSKYQCNEWWTKFLDLVLRIKNDPRVELGNIFTKGGALTDQNRNKIVKSHLEGQSDALFQVDDDTVPPMHVLLSLVGADRPVIGGIYHLRGSPYVPVAYVQNAHGSYEPLQQYEIGEIVEVDAVGMGCTLIRREVFETIQEDYDAWQLVTNSAYVAVPKSDEELVELPPEGLEKAPVLHRRGRTGYYTLPVRGPVDTLANEDADFPFYSLEVGRTEDLYFCEMARHCGFRIWVDTFVQADHLGTRPTNYEDYEQLRDEIQDFRQLLHEMGRIA